MSSTLRVFVFGFTLVFLLAGASSASADTILNYQITGPGSFTASFTLPQNPTPSGGNQLGFYFANLPVDVNGTGANLTVYFYNALIGQGIGGSNSFSLFSLGQQFYSWSASAATPTMGLGTFSALGAGAGMAVLYDGLNDASVADAFTQIAAIEAQPLDPRESVVPLAQANVALPVAEAGMLCELNCPVSANEQKRWTGTFRISAEPKPVERCLVYSRARVCRKSNSQPVRRSSYLHPGSSCQPIGNSAC